MNLQLSDITIGLTVIAFVYAWWSNISMRERALFKVKKHCESLSLQLLDDSVAGAGWVPTWANGGLKIKRTYKFEFSSSGVARYPGSITLLGEQQLSLWLSPHDF
ncbi:DUF3301 domain-containing protein [Marinomonas sp. M1K-6]|uniref:DUF3301 domain-containing protein n=1 Tax=Marinomonas profundi TaxID=2726122 RepID=A0A847R517_9GAMM|nr:DUF3301 domain-containing protein [Marinomonas profundi]NLQ16067.1 DUF3301 domain-containing protein [Marinomonas profundi]UDV03345.1 DUF3301 domain-containing protein [Marinomonas profundi]